MVAAFGNLPYSLGKDDKGVRSSLEDALKKNKPRLGSTLTMGASHRLVYKEKNEAFIGMKPYWLPRRRARFASTPGTRGRVAVQLPSIRCGGGMWETIRPAHVRL
jgi:hypothetical protein